LSVRWSGLGFRSEDELEGVFLSMMGCGEMDERRSWSRGRSQPKLTFEEALRDSRGFLLLESWPDESEYICASDTPRCQSNDPKVEWQA
jgi:hypothetical protein